MERIACMLQEIKFDAGDAATMTFSGYGAAFGNVDAFGDVIAKGAFADTLEEAKRTGVWPSMLSQHGGWGMTAEDLTPVGVWTDLDEDSKGLKVSGKLADTPRGQELYALMKMQPRPAIDGLSIGYIPKEWAARTKPEEPRRTLKKVHLVEISPVTFPANSKARVRSVKGADMTERDFERYLMQDAGFSRSEARQIIASGFKSLAAMQDAGARDPQLDAMHELYFPSKS
ncbi:MAG: HK97 family phage prohead protease [Roseovarius sp.]